MGDQLFLDARKTFLDSLPVKERARIPLCDSASGLIAALNDMEPIQKALKRNYQQSPASNINSLVDVIRPYFDCVNLMVAANSEVASPVWGALRLVLEMAATYATFFGRVTVLMHDIAVRFPQFAEFGQFLNTMGKEVPKAMQKTIIDLYSTLLLLIQELLKIFYKEPDRPRSKLSLNLRVMTTPWSSRFEAHMKELERHSAMFRDQLQILHYQEASLSNAIGDKNLAETLKVSKENQLEVRAIDSGLRRFEETLSKFLDGAEQEPQQTSPRGGTVNPSRDEIHDDIKQEVHENIPGVDQEQQRSRFRDWLRPPRFVDSFQQAKPSSGKQECRWFIDGEEYRSWKDGSYTSGQSGARSVLLVNGNPGAGKSALASSAVEDLLSTFSSASENPQVTYFFFRSGIARLDKRADAYRAILAQILNTRWTDSALMDYFSFALRCSQGQLVASELEIIDLLTLCVADLPGHFLVLDGIDECFDSHDLIEDLTSSEWCAHSKIVLFSRPTVPGLSIIIPDKTISVGRQNMADIRSYSSMMIDELIALDLFPRSLGKPGKPTRETLISQIILGAEGMFLWARLFLDHLRLGALTRSERRDLVLSIKRPERLDEVYDKILRNINQKTSEERSLAVNLLVCVCLANRPLDLEEISVAVMDRGEHMNSTDSDDEDEYQDFASTAVATCGALIELAPNGTFCFIHLSAREYLLNLLSSCSISHPLLNITIAEGHCILLQRSMNYIVRLLPHRVGIGSSRMAVADQFPFAIYSATNLFEHLMESMAALRKHIETSEAEFCPSPNQSRMLAKVSAMLEVLVRFLKVPDRFRLWLQLYYLFIGNFTTTPIKLQSLKAYTDFLETLPGSFPERFIISCRTLVEFGIALQNIQKDWGAHLIRDPDFVWEPEFSSFKTSQFLPPDPSMQVHVLLPLRPDKSNLAQNFSQKKTVFSHNGGFLFTLSIWPSRTYEEICAQIDRRSYSDTDISAFLKEQHSTTLFQGWLSLYEVWTLAGTPTRVIAINAEISSHDLEQLASNVYGPRIGKLEIPFELCIGQLRFFVLQTVFDVAYSGNMVQAQLESTRLDLGFSLTSDRTADVARFSDLTRHFRFSIYGNFFFSATCYRLNDETTLDLSIFEVDNSLALTVWFKSKIMLLSLQCSDDDMLCSDSTYFAAQFHTYLPLLLMVFHETVYVWDFTNEEGGLHDCFWSAIDPPRAFHFSLCGRFAIVKGIITGATSDMPLGAIIGHSRFSKLLSQSEDPRKTNADSTFASEVIPAASGETLIPRQFEKSIVRSDTNGVVVGQGSTTANSLSISRSHQSVSLERLTGDAIEKLELVKLPSISFDDMNILLPSPEDSYVTIIGVRDRSKPWHEDMKTGREYGDFVIRVKKDALKSPIKVPIEVPSKVPIEVSSKVRSHRSLMFSGEHLLRLEDDISLLSGIWERHKGSISPMTRALGHKTPTGPITRALAFERFSQRTVGVAVRQVACKYGLANVSVDRLSDVLPIPKEVGRIMAGDVLATSDILRYFRYVAKGFRVASLRRQYTDLKIIGELVHH